jgi:biotin carboxylase
MENGNGDKRCADVFVVGLDDVHGAQLKALPGSDRYRFHALFSHRQIKQAAQFPVQEMLDLGSARLRAFAQGVDAVIGYWDFPVSTLLPLLRSSVGLPGPSLESVLKCEHKYWSRRLQHEVVPAQVPAFAALDPFTADPQAGVSLPFPFWIKPVKAVLSQLGFAVTDAAGLEHALGRIRAGIARFAVPFNLILARATLPPGIAAVDGFHCIAESMIASGRQCTVEGYAWHGDVVCYGVVDSLREGPQGSSFTRYQYPSTLPPPVIARMATTCRRLMRHIGYDDAPFNIEFYWDADSDRLWLLEINPRISKSHAPLFQMVDGCYHHQVNLDLALGRRPDFPHRQGRYRCAAKFMLRHYGDARVVRVPSAAELDDLLADQPDAAIEILVEPGMRLSSLRNQESYSYEVAAVFLGGDDEQDLEARYRRLRERMPLTFEPAETVA